MKNEKVMSREDLEKTALDNLKKVSLNMNNIALTGIINPVDYDSIPNGSWDEQNGVIMFKTKNEVYAVPANTRTREIMGKTGLVQGGFDGIPNLNNADVWGDENRRNQMESFNQWVELSQQSREFEKNLNKE